MTEDFKKWLIKKGGENYNDRHFEPSIIEILVRTMWAINRKKRNGFYIEMDDDCFHVLHIDEGQRYFYFKDQSEEESLAKTLEYVYEHSKKEIKESVK